MILYVAATASELEVEEPKRRASVRGTEARMGKGLAHHHTQAHGRRRVRVKGPSVCPFQAKRQFTQNLLLVRGAFPLPIALFPQPTRGGSSQVFSPPSLPHLPSAPLPAQTPRSLLKMLMAPLGLQGLCCIPSPEQPWHRGWMFCTGTFHLRTAPGMPGVVLSDGLSSVAMLVFRQRLFYL
jgi:hypothetical protein